jgi:DNA-binding beta-propeller fold protein YncE
VHQDIGTGGYLFKATIFIFLLINLSALIVPDLSYPLECITCRSFFDISPNADQPSDIAIGPTGNIYLVDGVNDRILVMDPTGDLKFAIGESGTGEGQFNRPVGIDISNDGKVFVADTGNHRIQAFDAAGNYSYMFAVNTGSDKMPADPVDVLASEFKNYLYVSDNDNHKIKVFNQKGGFEYEWGKFGEGPGEFRYPGILATNEYNQVFVVDVLNTRVQVFDPFGNYINDIGAWGVRQGQLFRPKGVAVDRHNRAFISDSYMGLIQVYTSLGRFIGVVCENETKKQFTTPVGMAFDAGRNRLYVVEMRANRIHVLKVPD